MRIGWAASARVALAVICVTTLAGCGLLSASPGDKAGRVSAPKVLVLLNAGQTDAQVQHFVHLVSRMSHGQLQVRPRYQAAGTASPYVEKRVVTAVRRGSGDLGWVATRVWDLLGVSGLSALQTRS